MKSISLNMKFWDDGQEDSTRVRNVSFCWNQLKIVSEYLKNKGVEVSTTLYDFSPIKVVEDSVHIPYPIGTYKKAEKTNLILEQKKNYEFFMMIDSDAFFYKDDYEKLYDLISKLEKGDVCTFDLAKLDNNILEYISDNSFIIEKANWSYAYSGDRENGPLRHHIGGLGGVYISDTDLLVSLGGFNEKYEGWGGEDGDMMDRVFSSKIHHRILPTKNFAPFHLPHFSDWGNPLYSKRFND